MTKFTHTDCYLIPLDADGNDGNCVYILHEFLSTPRLQISKNELKSTGGGDRCREMYNYLYSGKGLVNSTSDFLCKSNCLKPGNISTTAVSVLGFVP